MSDHELARFIDHSALASNLRSADVSAACSEALEYGFRSVCVPSSFVPRVKRLLADGEVGVCSTVGFPHGNTPPDVKLFEAKRALEQGADEIDYVISIGAALDGDLRFVLEEARALVRAVKGAGVKAIIETGYFDADQQVVLANTLLDAGVTIVKTCTGFGPRGATVEEVRLLAETVKGRGFVKASGGIRDRATAIAMLRAGAALLGTSRGVAICTGDTGS